MNCFTRQHKGVELNQAGKQYYQNVNAVLSELQKQTDKLKKEYLAESLSILSLHAIAQLWLMPRLAQFTAAHPQINIQINASDNLTESSEQDLLIGFTLTPPSSPTALVLMPEDIFPVCSNDYKKQHRQQLSVNKLGEFDLLFDVHWKQDWDDWLRLNNASLALHQRKALSFSLYSMVIEAAVNGLGIMMGHKQLIQNELDSGKLIHIFEQTQTVKGYYYLDKNPNSTHSSVADQFQHWLIQQTQ